MARARLNRRAEILITRQQYRQAEPLGAATLEAAMLGVAMAAAVVAVVAASIRAFFACTRYLERLLTFGCGLTTSW